MYLKLLRKTAFIILLLVFILGCEQAPVYFDDVDLVTNKGEITWAGHNFKIAKKGNVEFTNEGFKVFGTSNQDDGLATTKLTDINLNQKIKIKITADMTGTYVSGDWSEFALYLAEKKDSFVDNKVGIALLGSRDNTAHSDAPRAGENLRNKFKFEWFTIENTGSEIIFSDSSGRNFNTLIQGNELEHSFSRLNSDEEWNVRINSHVKGEGTTELTFKIIEIL